jgi:homoserine O-succinyltransferase/O-acetyltransferase
VTVALVNNMPDAAFVDTEQQFRRAVADPGGGTVELQLYTIAELPRSVEIASEIRSRYGDLNALWARPPDALIVTGTEPAQAQLPYEPYWPILARLLEWAASSVPTTLLSCLAAHASVLLFDEIERVPRQVKCSGVFAGTVADPSDPLATGVPDLVPVPHSRMNDVPDAAMIEAGYRLVIGSGPAGAGWAVAARKYRDGLFVLCQGHPEYSVLSLLREYRRDVRRSLFGRGAIPFPRIPEGYLRPEAAEVLERFASRAAAPDVDPRKLWASFPFEEVAATVENTWAVPMATLYGNWLDMARAAAPAPTTAPA